MVRINDLHPDTPVGLSSFNMNNALIDCFDDLIVPENREKFDGFFLGGFVRRLGGNFTRLVIGFLRGKGQRQNNGSRSGKGD